MKGRSTSLRSRVRGQGSNCSSCLKVFKMSVCAVRGLPESLHCKRRPAKDNSTQSGKVYSISTPNVFYLPFLCVSTEPFGNVSYFLIVTGRHTEKTGYGNSHALSALPRPTILLTNAKVIRGRNERTSQSGLTHDNSPELSNPLTTQLPTPRVQPETN